MAGRTRKPNIPKESQSYEHKHSESLLRPDVGTQAQFRKKKDPKTYRYDPHLNPELSWDINADREKAEEFVAKIEQAESLEEAQAAARQLKAMSQPFLNWAGKAENQEFTVPTLPLFVHERLSTKAILESVKKRKRDKQEELSLFADEELDITDRILKAYVHKTPWTNRLILGDSQVVMNSLLQYESLGGQVQMIYMDPPYGIKFGSNFQPFVRKRDVKHGDDRDLTREPEMVKAYRDTWELGLHSYLTYLRDRFVLCRELLHPSGTIFVQISDENVHHVREILDEIFGWNNFCSLITFRTATDQPSKVISSVSDYILWYAKSKDEVKYNQLKRERSHKEKTSTFNWIELSDGESRRISNKEAAGEIILPEGRLFKDANLTQSTKEGDERKEVLFKGTRYPLPNGLNYIENIEKLVELNRVVVINERLCGKRYESDNPFVKYTNLWEDTILGTFALTKSPKRYAVETNSKVIERCMLMTTEPGDLVLDPTCGSGTTAYIGEQWGRRWITIDCSRVPLALTRQRLITATFPYYELRNSDAGVADGFKYLRKQNAKGVEVGGIVPHTTLKSMALDKPPKEDVLINKPEVDTQIIRVSGPFCVEATIPTPVDWEADGEEDSQTVSSEEITDHNLRMLEALRKSPVIRLPGNQTVEFKSVRKPANAMMLHAEAELVERTLSDLNEEAALQKGMDLKQGKPIAFVFGPANGAVSEQLVLQAVKEANAKNYFHLYVIGFACQDAATKLISNAKNALGIPVTYANATMDIQMGDLLKSTRSSQLFSVTGSPEVRLIKLKDKSDDGDTLYQVELLGLDVYYPPGYDPDKPGADEVLHESGKNVPAWFLDTDYNELCFYVSQAFFPRTKAWDGLKKDLKGQYDDSVWEHLAGAKSEPFVASDNQRIAVKVIDDRGNELLVVRSLDEAEEEK